MNAEHPKSLYVVEPGGERFIRWLRETTALAIRLYWDIFIGIPATIITMMLALIGTVVGIMDIARNPAHYGSDLPLIGICLAFIIFQRVRAFCWALLGCSVLWIVLLALVLIPILGQDYEGGTTAAKILLGVADFLPPIIGALYIDHARHRKSPPLGNPP